jgi:hypothetical protein
LTDLWLRRRRRKKKRKKRRRRRLSKRKRKPKLLLSRRPESEVSPLAFAAHSAITLICNPCSLEGYVVVVVAVVEVY